MNPRGILGNYAAIVFLALFLGLATGGFPGYASEITIISLAVMMTLSLSNVRGGGESKREVMSQVAYAILLNYGLLTALIIAISLLYSGDLRTGWVLMAAVPSAVAVVPFSYMIRGDTKVALVGTTAIYLLSLAIAPVITLSLVGQELDRWQLIYTIVLMIVIPLAVSRLPQLRNLSPGIKTPSINICFGVLVFAMTGANRGAFGEDPSMVFWVAIASLVRTFGVGLAVMLALRAREMRSEKARVFVLFSSYKNLGLTAAIAMALVGSDAAIPATICIPFEIVWLLVLKMICARRDAHDRSR